MLLNFVVNVSKNKKFIVELLTRPSALEAEFVCANFFARIFKTEAKSGNKYKHNTKYK
jgi:hypothetical protein